MGRRLDCVACGSVQGIENLSIIIPKEATFGLLFSIIEQHGFKLDSNKWTITNDMTKEFVYLPGNPNSPTVLDKCSEKGISDLTFYKFSTAPANAIKEIHILNVQITYGD